MASTYYSNISYDALNVGIRDWDGGSSVFINFIEALGARNVKVVSTNLNFSSAGSSYSKVLESVTINRGGTDIKIIGLASKETPFQAQLPSQVKLYPDAVSRILPLLGTSKIVIMLSKAETYEEDSAIMEVFKNQIDIVVSSYKGKFFANNMDFASSGRIGSYPLVHGFGNATAPYWLLVSPADMGKGLGYLNVTFDDDGFITEWAGDMIWLNRTRYPPDPYIEADLYSRYLEVEKFSANKVGESKVKLVGDGSDPLKPCRFRECNMGSLIADAMREYARTDIAFVGGGALRANITTSNITYGDVLSVVPFLNNLAKFSVYGDKLIKILEHSVSRVFAASGSGRFLQVSGIRYSWNINKDAGVNRIIDIQIWQNSTRSWVPLDPREIYSIATTNFMYSGGDRYSDVGLPSEAFSAFPYGPLITDLLIDYLSKRVGPQAINLPDVEQRILATDSLEAFTPRAPFVPIKAVPEGLSIAFVIITGIFAAVPILLAGYFVHHRRHAVVVIASPLFCYIIIGGSLLGYLALFIYLLVENNGGCMAFPWLGNYAFVLIFGSLFAKTWRIYRVFSVTRKLRSTKQPNSTLLYILISLVLIETLIMGLWQGLSPLKYTLNLDRGRQERRYTCSSEYGVYFFAASVAYKGILMVWGMYLVVKTRNIESDFREATFIGWIIYAVFLTCAIIITISLLLKGNILAVYILIVIGFWIVIGAVIGALFIPKVLEIRSNPDMPWSTYFHRRAESRKVGASRSMSTSTYWSSASQPTEEIEQVFRRMKPEEQQEMYEEMQERKKTLTQSLKELEQELITVEKILKKQKSKSASK